MGVVALRTVTLTAGTVEYVDTGGDGPVVVLLHGVLMDDAAWQPVIDELTPEHRCIVPLLPFAAHRIPLRANADLSLPGLAELLGEFVDALELTEITVASNDWGGGQLMVAARPARVARLVLTPGEAFDNFPPGLPGKFAGIAGRSDLGIALAARTLRVPLLRDQPVGFGWMAKHALPQDLFDRWASKALRDKAIRRDLANYVRHARKSDMIAYTERLTEFDKPALVVWASEDKVMPREHGPRLAEILPRGRLEWVDDSYVLMPLDQPSKLAALIAAFIAETATERGKPAF